MVASKTRIWRGGLAEIMRKSEPTVALATEPGLDARAPAQPLDSASPNGQPSTRRTSTRSQRATLVGHAIDLRALEQTPRSQALSTTRLVPIESLLAPTAEASTTGEPARHAPEADSDDVGLAALLPRKWPHKLPPISMVHVRRGAMALLALFVLGVWSLRGQDGAVARKPLQPASAKVQRVEQAHSSAPTQPAPQVDKPTTVAVPHPRGAVDALASGDYVAAQRLYAELAQQVAGRSAYSEAARILAERLQNTSER